MSTFTIEVRLWLSRLLCRWAFSLIPTARPYGQHDALMRSSILDRVDFVTVHQHFGEHEYTLEI